MLLLASKCTLGLQANNPGVFQGATRLFAAAVAPSQMPQTLSSPETLSESSYQFELTAAERARTTAEQGMEFGLALSTVSDDNPWTSFADYALDKRGRPILLLEKEHMKNIKNRVSVLLQAQSSERNAVVDVSGPADRSRATLSGSLTSLDADSPFDDGEDYALMESIFCLEHAYAEALLRDRPETFSLFRIEPSSIQYVGGFGAAAHRVEPELYAEAAPDVVAFGAKDIVEELNDEKHAADRFAAAKHLLQVQDAKSVTILHLDRLCIDFRVHRPNRKEDFRLAYRLKPKSLDDAKSEVNKLLQEAWEADNNLNFDGNYLHKPSFLKYSD